MLNGRCGGSRAKYALCAGAYTKRTQHYTEKIVKITHQSLNRDARVHGVLDALACSFVCFELSASPVDQNKFCSCLQVKHRLSLCFAPFAKIWAPCLPRHTLGQLRSLVVPPQGKDKHRPRPRGRLQIHRKLVVYRRLQCRRPPDNLESMRRCRCRVGDRLTLRRPPCRPPRLPLVVSS